MEKLSTYSPGYAAHKVTRTDNYIHEYLGQEYSGKGQGRHGAMVVMTMSMQWLMGNDTLKRQALFTFDRELFNFSVGVLFHYAP